MSSSTSAAIRSSASGRTDVRVEHLTYEWIINNFKLLPYENGESLYSPIFHTMDNELKWKLCVFPQGKKTEDAGYLSVFLHLVSHKAEEINIKVHATLSILPTEIIHKFEYTFKEKQGRGPNKLIQRSELLESCTSNDTVKIRCEVAIARETITEPMDTTECTDQAFDLQQGQLSQAFRPLFKESKFSDVVVIVGNEKFPAHKLVLAARSPVFSAMFENEETHENLKNEVKIEGMEPSVVEAMLEFFYTDEVTHLKEQAYGLLEAADKYDVQLLRSMCEEALHKAINKDNATEILVLANLHRSYQLKKYVMEFISDHFSEVEESEGYKEMKDLELLKELMHSMNVRKSSRK